MLATAINSLALASRSKLRPRIPLRSYMLLGQYNCLSPSQFQALFTGIFCFLFSFPSRYLYAIGLGVYLGLRVNTSRIRTQKPLSPTLELRTPGTLFAYKALTFSDGAFQPTSAKGSALKAGPNTTSANALPRGFGLPCSTFVRTTDGIAVAFSSSRY